MVDKIVTCWLPFGIQDKQHPYNSTKQLVLLESQANWCIVNITKNEEIVNAQVTI